MEEQRVAQNPISKLNLILMSSGLLFVVGSYMSVGATDNFLYPGQYFFVAGIVLSGIGMISLLLKQDF